MIPTDAPHTNQASPAEADALTTCAPAAIERLFVEMGTASIDTEQRPTPLFPADQVFARELARENEELAVVPATLER